jgi:integrase
LRPFLGGLPLDSIGTGILNDWITSLVKAGLDPKTVENKYKYFTQIMNWHAKQNDQPKRTWYPDLPPIPDKEARSYLPHEMIQIIDASESYPAWGQPKGQYKPLFRLDAFGGFRSGEVTGLIVEDLDFASGIVHVQRSIYKGKEVPTKGKRNRKVIVDSITMQMVQDFLGGRTTGRVFRSRVGTPIRNSQLNIVLTKVTAGLGLKRGTMHGFRHGRISLLAACGVSDKIIREQVGHRNQRTTDKYTHTELSVVRDTMERLAISCTQTQKLNIMGMAASDTLQGS